MTGRTFPLMQCTLLPKTTHQKCQILMPSKMWASQSTTVWLSHPNNPAREYEEGGGKRRVGEGRGSDLIPLVIADSLELEDCTLFSLWDTNRRCDFSRSKADATLQTACLPRQCIRILSCHLRVMNSPAESPCQSIIYLNKFLYRKSPPYLFSTWTGA